MKTITTYNNHLGELTLTRQMLQDICRPGANDEAVNVHHKEFVKLNNLEPDDETEREKKRENVIKALLETGGWSREELETQPWEDFDLWEKLLWVSAWDAKEQEENEEVECVMYSKEWSQDDIEFGDTDSETETESLTYTVGELVRLFKGLNPSEWPIQNPERVWFSWSEEDYRTGGVTEYSLHPAKGSEEGWGRAVELWEETK